MKFISLFAGIGGFDLGLERAGMTCVAQVDNNEFCQKVLAKHWPDVPRFGDIRDVGRHNLPAADLICGGFPCQPFSVAGKQRGTDDDRHLWPEMLRVITELKPAWVVGENVPGIISIFIDQAISDLEGQGYTCEPFVFPACAFDARHIRYRLFFVAYAHGERFSEVGSMGYDEIQQAKRKEMFEVGGGGEFVEYSGRNGGKHNGKTWPVEPGVGRVVNGISHRMDRIRGLGNAVVPQVAEFIGRVIMDAEDVLNV